MDGFQDIIFAVYITPIFFFRLDRLRIRKSDDQRRLFTCCSYHQLVHINQPLSNSVFSMESRMVPCLIILISYMKHQNNNLAKFSRNTTLLFDHNNNYVSSADFSRIFYYFVLETNTILLYPTNNN